ncbi:hypothetical protein M947_07335 [Sulfurimonas hongkongensis]|uniref:Rhodanese domain-containing protein n=1 Tax=Sulfurimonas hongkongensis TaxID=1172190 RepID=T0KQL6_9BACT|nr:rhodanese-like domain-containing protein [Sulfurimonas hongkongensis]EQB39274.1 hypothetical protein M947_07335 [Sulfurimonas hongkongensis]
MLKHSKLMIKYFLLLSLSVFSLFASDAFIAPAELRASLNDKNLILIDVSQKELYDTSHIEGAIHVSVKEFIDKNSLNLYPSLKPDESIQKTLRKIGISNDSKVVIYSHNSEKAIFDASYLAFVLFYSGLENISILDGGYMAWVFQNNLLVSSLTPDIKAGTIIIKPKKHLIANTKDMRNSDAKILDARSYDDYYGVSRSDGILGLGHIKGAKSSYTATKFLKDSTLRSKRELDEIYLAGHELNSDDEIIVYDRDAISASMEFFILYQKMGFKNTKLYEASLLEWSNKQNLPMIRFKWE